MFQTYNKMLYQNRKLSYQDKLYLIIGQMLKLLLIYQGKDLHIICAAFIMLDSQLYLVHYLLGFLNSLFYYNISTKLVYHIIIMQFLQIIKCSYIIKFNSMYGYVRMISVTLLMALGLIDLCSQLLDYSQVYMIYEYILLLTINQKFYQSSMKNVLPLKYQIIILGISLIFAISTYYAIYCVEILACQIQLTIFSLYTLNQIYQKVNLQHKNHFLLCYYRFFFFLLKLDALYSQKNDNMQIRYLLTSVIVCFLQVAFIFEQNLSTSKTILKLKNIKQCHNQIKLTQLTQFQIQFVTMMKKYYQFPDINNDQLLQNFLQVCKNDLDQCENIVYQISTFKRAQKINFTPTIFSKSNIATQVNDYQFLQMHYDSINKPKLISQLKIYGSNTTYIYEPQMKEKYGLILSFLHHSKQQNITILQNIQFSVESLKILCQAFYYLNDALSQNNFFNQLFQQRVLAYEFQLQNYIQSDLVLLKSNNNIIRHLLNQSPEVLQKVYICDFIAQIVPNYPVKWGGTYQNCVIQVSDQKIYFLKEIMSLLSNIIFQPMLEINLNFYNRILRVSFPQARQLSAANKFYSLFSVIGGQNFIIGQTLNMKQYRVSNSIQIDSDDILYARSIQSIYGMFNISSNIKYFCIKNKQIFIQNENKSYNLSHPLTPDYILKILQ
ncbi:Transmembrane domain-containing protein [Spironucleus salmonicida]|uniref:Transmembrane domain-containing protein n=1 Tax=Spironucleus salmonicida TaxID=348837 RepID=A0A9P8LQM2_9EUKA|nr:Transmembrane domain-containing protein [Spironucleus salmonicida]